MAARRADPVRRFLNLTTLLALLALASLSFAVWGWSALSARLDLTLSDVLYRSIGSLTLLTFYEDSKFFFHDWRIELARWFGAATFIVIATKAVTTLLSRQIAEFGGKFRRNHLLIIGDQRVARAMAEAAAARRVKTTWVTDGYDPERAIPGVLILNRRWDRDLAEQYGVTRARKCLVAFNDEARLIAAVRDLRLVSPSVPVVMNCADPWFAERMDELENISGVRIVSEAQLALRALHWQHPPFMIAKALGQPRIHALFLGFGRGGEAALTDLLLSSLTSFLGRPRVTIIDPRAAEIEASLALRCPDLAASIEIHAINPGFSYDSRMMPRAAIAAAHEALPLTVAYVCLNSDQRSLAAAISLQALLRREGWTMGPIFTRLSAQGALPDQRSIGEDGQSAGLVSFGSMYDFAAGIGLFESDPDALAKAFHAAYLRAAPRHAAANQPWDQLSEEHRESNRRLVIHLPAKLASAGFDLMGWLRGHQSQSAGAGPIDAPDLAGNPALLERLAELEHERWMAERRLGGWQPGTRRDNFRRIHPDLRPYAELSETTKQFDREIIMAANAALRAAR